MTMLAQGGGREQEVWAQLSRVTDPELDEAVTDLDFIEALEVGDGGEVCIRYRLPTYWCAANFAFMMGHDMKEMVGELRWVQSLRVELLDHFYADAINRGLAGDASFEQTCGGAAEGGLPLLRATFRRKAFLGRQERLLQHCLTAGGADGDLVRMTVAGLAAVDMAADPDGSHLRSRYLEMRREGAPDQPKDTPYRDDRTELSFVTTTGEALSQAELSVHLRRSRSVRLNSEFNAHLCRSVLEARKGSRGPSAGRGLAQNPRREWQSVTIK